MNRCVHGVYMVSDKMNPTLNSACSLCAGYVESGKILSSAEFRAKHVEPVIEDGITETDVDPEPDEETDEEDLE